MSIMRSNLLGCLSVVALCGAGHAATIVPVAPVPGSTATNAFGINDSNVIVGSYIDSSGLEHGFFGPVNGTYTTLDTGPGGTQAHGINNDGYVVGFSNSQDGTSDTQPMFERFPDGTVTTVTRFGGLTFGQAYGIANRTNRFVGGRWSHHDFQLLAYAGLNAEWRRDLAIGVVHESGFAEGINRRSEISGSVGGPGHGFILRRTDLTLVDFPDDPGGTTTLHGINDRHRAVGQWVDADGHSHSFVFEPSTATFTDILVKGATDVEGWGINNAGAVAVTTNIGSFLWCEHKRSCPAGGAPLDAPRHTSPASVRHIALQSGL